MIKLPVYIDQGYDELRKMYLDFDREIGSLNSQKNQNEELLNRLTELIYSTDLTLEQKAKNQKRIEELSEWLEKYKKNIGPITRQAEFMNKKLNEIKPKNQRRRLKTANYKL